MSTMDRWIHRGTDGQRRHGRDAPGDDLPEGSLHCVGQGTRAAVVNGVLFVDGKEATPGQRKLAFRDADVEITVRKGGRAERQRKPKGGGSGGRSN